MSTSIITYISTLCLLLLFDIPWLMIMSTRLYKPALNTLLRPSPELLPIILFYAIYALGISYFIIIPSAATNYELTHLFTSGALFGLVAYATCDLTNQAVLHSWPWFITCIDLCWGMFLTAIISGSIGALMRWIL